MPESMLYGLLVGLVVALGLFFLMCVVLVFVNFKYSAAVRDEVRGLTEAVKKMSEAVVAMKEAVQVVYARSFNRHNDDFEEIAPKKEAARKPM